MKIRPNLLKLVQYIVPIQNNFSKINDKSSLPCIVSLLKEEKKIISALQK